MFKRLALLLGLSGGFAVVGAFLAVSPGGAQTSGGRTLVFSGGPPAFHVVDNPPKGASIGDIKISSAILRGAKGKRLGRQQFVCIQASSAATNFDQCTGAYILTNGHIVIAGPVGGPVDRGGTFAVVGGTGAYDGARGSVTIQTLKNGSHITIRLLSP